MFLAQVAPIICISLGLSGLVLCGPPAPLPGALPSPLPSPTATASPRPTPTPTPTIAPTIAPTATPTIVPPPTATPVATSSATPIALVKTDVNAFSILAPAQPLPETTPAPLCIAGGQYTYLQGDDFTQETQAQFARYTTSWEINQFKYPAPNFTGTTNWVWSDALSGIGRGNNAGVDDSYYVHIDDANAANSFPGPWVNDVRPRPGPQIIGTPPNAYMLIRGVYAPPGHDADMGGRHWLSGTIEGNTFTYGYTETTAEFTDGEGWWPSDWTEVTPSGTNYDGKGNGYQEFDTFEYFGGHAGARSIQQTRIGGPPPGSIFSRTTVADHDVAYHTYGQLWVPPILGQDSYIVFYVDRVPTSYFFFGAGQANMNPIAVLQIGAVGSFVGSPSPASIGELKLKNYFTWQNTGKPCDAVAAANPVPTPSASPTPFPAPVVAANVVPKLQPYIAPSTQNYKQAFLPFVPAMGDLVIIQGISPFSKCPIGFTTTGFGNDYLCTGIVGQNGVVASTVYQIDGNSLDKSNAVYVHGVTSYTVTPPSFANGLTSSPGAFSTSVTVPNANSLLLAFGFNYGDASHPVSSTVYTSDSPMSIVYQSDSDASLNDGIAMMQTSVDPFTAPGHTVTYTGTYAFSGSGNNSMFPQIFTVVVQ